MPIAFPTMQKSQFLTICKLVSVKKRQSKDQQEPVVITVTNAFQHCCTVLRWQVHKCFLHPAPTYLSSKFTTNSQSVWLLSHMWKWEFSLKQPKD